MKTLTRPELEQVRDALLAGYGRWAELDQLAAFALDLDLEVELGRGGALRDITFELLRFTQARGWTEVLLREATTEPLPSVMLADCRQSSRSRLFRSRYQRPGSVSSNWKVLD